MSEIHHTASILLESEEEECAYIAVEETIRELLTDESLPAGAVFKGLFVVAVLSIHQLTGSLSPGRALFEHVMRKTNFLFDPQLRSGDVLPLFPDKDQARKDYDK